MLGSLADYDGDGDMSEGIYYEGYDLRMMLYDAIQQYAAQISGADICYDSHAYPYFFNDSNGNGVCDPDEANYGNQLFWLDSSFAQSWLQLSGCQQGSWWLYPQR